MTKSHGHDNQVEFVVDNLVFLTGCPVDKKAFLCRTLNSWLYIKGLYPSQILFPLSKGQYRDISGLLPQAYTLACSDACVINAIMLKCTKPHTLPIIHLSYFKINKAKLESKTGSM